MNAQPQPATRNVGGRPLGFNRRRKELVDGYVTALGGRVTPLVMADIERAVDLLMLARAARIALLKGEGNINATVKIENAADRAMRRLNLPAAGAGGNEPVADLQAYLATKAAGAS